MRNRRVLFSAATGGFYYVGVYAYIAASPFAFITYHHVSASLYGLLFAAGIVGIMAMNLVNVRLGPRFGGLRIMRAGALIAAAGGLGDRAVGDALTGSLVGQLTGSGLAVILAGRVRYPAAFMAAAVCTLGAWAVFLHPPSILAFALASSVTGLGGLFLTPFFVPMSLAADPTRRTATMVGGAQLLGAATGPVLAAPISEHAPLILAAGSLCVSLSLTGALCLHFLLTKHQKEVAP